MRRLLLLITTTLAFAASAAPAIDQTLPQLKAYEAQPGWLTPTEPLRLSDHVWQIGTAGITALLVKTDQGALLIDGGMPQAADLLLAHMHGLGVAPQELRLILHSHAHADHAGALAAVKRATGARLVSNAESAVLLARGGHGDIHFGDTITYPPVQADRLLQDGETVTLGGMTFTVAFTPGHTPGSMSWTWSDTQQSKTLHFAYVDSLSAPGYRLVGNPAYPQLMHAFAQSAATVRQLPCDVLLTPHPEQSGWNYANAKAPHPEPMSCAEYADKAQLQLIRQAQQQRTPPLH